MPLVQSIGLQELLKADAVYAQRYAALVQRAGTSSFGALKVNYSGEHTSWRNRKSWAKQNGIAWHSSISSFKDFLRVCGQKPSPDCTLDRINFKGPYSPENLRWGNRKVQNNNKGNSVRIRVGNESLTMTELAARTDRTYDSVRMGIQRHGEQWASTLIPRAPGLIRGKEKEHTWQFPKEGAAELEARYSLRRDKSQSRLRFFLIDTKYELHAWDTQLARASEGRKHLYQGIVEGIRKSHNDAVDFYKQCYEEPDEEERMVGPDDYDGAEFQPMPPEPPPPPWVQALIDKDDKDRQAAIAFAFGPEDSERKELRPEVVIDESEWAKSSVEIRNSSSGVVHATYVRVRRHLLTSESAAQLLAGLP